MNLEIDDELVERVRTRYKLRTKTEAIDLALRRVAFEPMTREEALAMRGAFPDFEVPHDEFVPPDYG